jgi:hypothetical protein
MSSKKNLPLVNTTICPLTNQLEEFVCRERGIVFLQLLTDRLLLGLGCSNGFASCGTV